MMFWKLHGQGQICRATFVFVVRLAVNERKRADSSETDTNRNKGDFSVLHASHGTRMYTKHVPGSMDHPMEPDRVHVPPLIFKRKSPLLI